MDFDGIDMQHMLKIADPDTHKKFLKNLPPKVQGRTHALLGFEQDAKVLRDECEKETTALMEKYTELFKVAPHLTLDCNHFSPFHLLQFPHPFSTEQNVYSIGVTEWGAKSAE